MEGENITVLLVEDNPGDARLVKEFVVTSSKGKIDLEHVEELGQALPLLVEVTYDVVLLDLSLPDAHGIEVVERVHETVPDTPIIVLTGRADEEIALEALRVGAQDYFLKVNITSFALERTMRYAIERHRWRSTMLDMQEKIANDLHQPLSRLVELTELVLDRTGPDNDQRSNLKAIHELAQKSQGVVQEVYWEEDDG